MQQADSLQSFVIFKIEPRYKMDDELLKIHEVIRFDYVVATFSRYGTLLELGEKRKDMLEKSCKKFMLFREANELQQWINEKESALTNEEVGSDLEQVEVLQKKFDDFQKVMSAHVLKPKAWHHIPRQFTMGTSANVTWFVHIH